MKNIQQYTPLLFMFAVFIILYLMIILPQRNYQKKRKKILDSLKIGDKIVTIGGIYGTISKVAEDGLRIKIAQNVEIKTTKESVSKKVE